MGGGRGERERLGGKDREKSRPGSAAPSLTGRSLEGKAGRNPGQDQLPPVLPAEVMLRWTKLATARNKAQARRVGLQSGGGGGSEYIELSHLLNIS